MVCKKGTARVYFTAAACPLCAASFPFRRVWRACTLCRSFYTLRRAAPLWNILLVGLGAAAEQSWPRVAAAIASASVVLKWVLGLAAAVLLAMMLIRRRAVDAKRRRTL